jgi:hypothetical protein
VTNGTGAGTLTIASEGSTTIGYQGVDFAGNVEPAQSRMVLIDRAAPTLTISATPNELWPANGKLVAVRVTGTAADDRSGLRSATYQVTDEYGETQPTGAVSVQPSGAFAFTLNLPARRDGQDKDGRTFTVTVRLVDAAGNAQTATVLVRLHEKKSQSPKGPISRERLLDRSRRERRHHGIAGGVWMKVIE